jgi:hypothetical protein
MNKRKLLRLLFLAGAAALLIAAYLVWSALSSRASDTGETVLFQAGDIVEIQSSYAGEEQVFIKEQGVWVLKSDAAFPLNTTYIGDMEEALSSLVATGKLESDDLAEYGLAVPAFEIAATTASGKTFACSVGNENNTADVVYLRTGGSIYTVDIGFSRRFSHTLLEMVEKQPLLNLQPSDVTEITLENGNGNWSLKRDPTAIPKGYANIEWVRNDGAAADAEQAKALISAVAGMRAEETIAYQPDEATLSRYGFDQPLASIGIRYGKTEWTAQIGSKTADGLTYVWLPGTQLLATFSSAVPEELASLTPQDSLNRQVFPVEFEGLTYADVESGGTSNRVDFSQEGSAWDFYYALSTMRAEQLATSQSTENASVTITIHTTDPSETYVLSFEKYNEDFYSVSVLDSVQLVNKRDVEQLLKILEA